RRHLHARRAGHHALPRYHCARAAHALLARVDVGCAVGSRKLQPGAWALPFCGRQARPIERCPGPMSEHDDLIDAFLRGREDLLGAAERIAAPERRTPFVGHWSVMDVLAHLVGWDYTNVEAIEATRAGRLPAFYRHYDPGWAGYNQALIER